MVYNEGGYSERYVYDRNSQRVSLELDYLPTTKLGEAGENLIADIAVNITKKITYRTNILGSDVVGLDESGKVVLHTQYDEWGSPETSTEFTSNEAGLDKAAYYTGYTYDNTLNLYYAQNRFYDPELRRFTQEDPIKSGLNWYSYVGNNPMNAVDPWGLIPLIDTGDGNKVTQPDYVAPINNSISGSASKAVSSNSLKLGCVNILLNKTSFSGEVFGSSVYGKIRESLKCYGIILDSEYGYYEELESMYYGGSSSDGKYSVEFIPNFNKMTITNNMTGSKREITTLGVDGINYVPIDNFKQFMCELDYKADVSYQMSSDTEVLMQGKLTAEDLELAASNPTAYYTLNQLNATWVEICKREAEGYDIINMKSELLNLMDVAREFGKKNKIGVYDEAIHKNASLNNVEKILLSEYESILWNELYYGNIAKNLTEERYGNADVVATEGDAFRHAYWSYAITMSVGSDRATLFTDAHEYAHASNFYRSNILYTQMDLNNNHTAINAAQNRPFLDSTPWPTAIDNLISQGKLVVIEGGILVPTE